MIPSSSSSVVYLKERAQQGQTVFKEIIGSEHRQDSGDPRVGLKYEGVYVTPTIYKRSQVPSL